MNPPTVNDAVLKSWIHVEKRRYYGVHLQLDLFGDWTLLRNWGSLDNGRGQMHLDSVPDSATGHRMIANIQRRRLAHGYLPVSDMTRQGQARGIYADIDQKSQGNIDDR